MRRRERNSRTNLVAQPSQNRRAVVRQRPPREAPSIDSEQIQQAVAEGATFTIGYVFRVFSNALLWAQLPLSILGAVVIVSWVAIYAMNMLSPVFGLVVNVATPLCVLPGTSGLFFCRKGFGHTDTPTQPQWADFPKLMEVQSSAFEQLLDSTVGSSELSLEVKKAEMATADLITLVKVSDLKSKELLSRTLEEFVNDAKRTGRDLQKLSSKVSGSVDRYAFFRCDRDAEDLIFFFSIFAVNDYALRSIEAKKDEHPSALAVLWRPFNNAVDNTAELVRGMFSDAMGVVSNHISRLVLEAHASLADLEHLDERLQVLHEIVARENASVTAEKDELLAQLWTFLGGNRRELKGLDGHLDLLKNIGTFRKRAQAHVIAALQALQAMSEDMEDLRQRTAAPELVGERIPVEVHIKSIQAGLDRLNQKRIQAQHRGEVAVNKFLAVAGQ